MDLNKGREGGFLYLIWKSVVVVDSSLRYISGYSVLYGTQSSEEPHNAVTTLDDNGDDIKQGFEGAYAWIVPRYTNHILNSKPG
ncbi:hypothetical protein Clacol_006930 [Clathrus columnatus]|uniref:Uncharacterized protein n=1 Tax=Clathrus columnatus TaxID=1419009 RepID=A0AAV5AIC0_9AGAM|nr:hypothetical protein Clacol_006930 [Clathrus columnatus]